MIQIDSISIEECGKLLADRHLTIAFAESATAGSLTAAFSSLPNAGAFLKGGLVCYDACVKEDVLGVPRDLIETYTPESPEVTEAMAFGLKKYMDADVIVAVTGLPSPGGSENEEKPVGTMFYCMLFDNQTMHCRSLFSGPPDFIISRTIEQISASITKALIRRPAHSKIVS